MTSAQWASVISSWNMIVPATLVLKVISCILLRFKNTIWTVLASFLAMFSTAVALAAFYAVDPHLAFILQTTTAVFSTGFMLGAYCVPPCVILFSIMTIYLFESVIIRVTFVHFLIWIGALAIAYDRIISRNTSEIILAAEHRSTLLARVSHDLRTPLNGIIAGIALILKDVDEASRQRLLGIVHSCANQMLCLINDILDLSKISLGQLKLVASPVNLLTIVKESISIIVPLAIEKQIDVKIQVQDGPQLLCSGKSLAGEGVATNSVCLGNSTGSIPQLVLVDRIRVLQLLNNLLTNAFKFTEKGYILTSIWFSKMKAEHCWMANISVKDSGVGLTKNQLNHIMNLAQREIILDMREPVPTSSAVICPGIGFSGGWGLGLQIVQQIVQQMGGTLLARSEGENLGATFTLQFPVQEVEEVDKPPNGKLDRDYCPTINLSGRHVLISDDDLVNQLILAQVLKRVFKSDCDVAVDGCDAIEKVRSNGINYYDLILMDILMPKLTGDQAAAQIRDMGCTVPIIAVSANFRTNGPMPMFDEYLEKPISVSSLGKAIEKVLSKRQSNLIEFESE